MDARRIELPYDETAEYMMYRVHLLRFGVPTRVLDKEVPVPAEA